MLHLRQNAFQQGVVRRLRGKNGDKIFQNVVRGNSLFKLQTVVLLA